MTGQYRIGMKEKGPQYLPSKELHWMIWLGLGKVLCTVIHKTCSDRFDFSVVAPKDGDDDDEPKDDEDKDEEGGGDDAKED